MVPVAILDACVLYAAPLRDFFLRAARAGLLRALWSEKILDECFRNLQAKRPELKQEALARTRDLMNKAIRDPIVVGYESRIDTLTLPDPDDRHVLAAAIHANATKIITFNLKDFPKQVVNHHKIEVISPDFFVLQILEKSSSEVVNVIREQARVLRNPPKTAVDIVESLKINGLSQSAIHLQDLLAD
jgi:predicted nucleic acid-binding protein